MIKPKSIILGTGIHDLSYYSTEIVFKNCILQAEAFWNQKHANDWSDDKTGLPIDDVFPSSNPAQGWWRTHMRKGLPVYEGGRYLLITDGEADFVFDGDARATLSGAGSFIVNPTQEGFSLCIKNIRRRITYLAIYHEQYLTDPAFGSPIDNPLHPLFVENIKPYKILRFMDANGVFSEAGESISYRDTDEREPQNTSVGKNTSPAGGKHWTRYWSNNQGMNVDRMVGICNTTGKDLYLCIPPKATTAYAVALYSIVRTRLNKQLKLYVEYANELWNLAFPQSVWAAQMADNTPGIGIPYHKYWFRQGQDDACENPFLAMFWQAYRGGRLFDVMRETSTFKEIGNTEFVFAVQTAASTWTLQEVLSHNDAYKKFTMIACNGYFGHDESVPWGQNDNVWFNYLKWKIGEPSDFRVQHPEWGEQLGVWLRNIKYVAKFYNLKLIAYEGGQHIVGRTPEQRSEWFKIQRKSWFHEIYMFLFKKWVDIMGEDAPFIHYYNIGTWGNFGSWGAKEHHLDVNSPKYNAIVNASVGGIQL